MHDAHRVLDLLERGLDVGLGARTWSLGREEVRLALVALRLMLVRASAAQDDGQTPGRDTQQRMQANLRATASRARADVENPALADPEVGQPAELGQLPPPAR